MISFAAKVIAGRGRGKRIGFPTANLDKKNLAIDYGVYLVAVEVAKKNYSALMHYGAKPTFAEGMALELYIKNFSNYIYNKNIKVKIIKKIREIKKFKNKDELIKQIKKDIEYV